MAIGFRGIPHISLGVKTNSSSDVVFLSNVTGTLLWNNPSPASGFAGQTITLSSSIENYDLIEIVWDFSTNYAYGGRILITPGDLAQSDGTRNTMCPQFCMNVINSSSRYVRLFYYVSDTQIRFQPCYSFGTTTAANSYVIPRTIRGYNF